jgi:hypothetical protein
MKTKIYEMNDGVTVTYEVSENPEEIRGFCLSNITPDFRQSGQMSKFIRELDKEFSINDKE